MELKTTADRRDYLYVQAWVDEPASGMDVINLLSDLTTVLARVEELEKENAKLLGYANQCRMDTDKVERELRGMYNEKMRHLRTQTRTVCPWPDDKKCPEGGSCDACIKGIAVELSASQRQAQRLAESKGVELISAERCRQIEKECWTPGHDRTHVNGELAFFACYYAMPEEVLFLRQEHIHIPLQYEGCAHKKWDLCTRDKSFIVPGDFIPNGWEGKRFNTETPRTIIDDKITNLTKAGALIAAEIERLEWVKGGE